MYCDGQLTVTLFWFHKPINHTAAIFVIAAPQFIGRGVCPFTGIYRNK